MTKRKHILMLLQNNAYSHDVRVRNEAQSLVAAGYDVTVICPADGKRFTFRDVAGVRVWSYPPPRDGNGVIGYAIEYGYSLIMMGLFSLLVLLRRRFDVVHAHNPPDMLVLIALFYKMLGKKFVFDHHDLSPELYRYARFSGSGNAVLFRLLIFFEMLSCKVADRVIAVNQSYRDVEVKRAKIKPEKISIVRNGPNLAQFALSHVANPSEKNGKIVIGYLGIIGYQDGVDHLVRAVGHLVNDFGKSDIECVVVGEGDALPAAQQLANELKLSEYITFIGWIPYTSVPECLRRFDICVAPEPSNIYSDRSTVIKIMEYMAFAKPIVAYDLPEHRYSAGEAAVYATNNTPLELAQHIAALIDDPQRRETMGQAGRERVENVLSWSHQERALLEMYSSL
ncbi:MAG: glycosyltransferase WbuB [Chloroflexi bacterium]|nr:MAG: glycosyltransferase WbuB [Phototrophicales bacterium]RMF81833.1 MAG: glycosyltransferase WbuB [Chloroflexota bacterium]